MDRPTTRRRLRAAVADRRAPGGCDTERASALVLAPALVLVLICLGGLAVDMSVLHGAHRAVHRAVSSAADDAAGMIDQDAMQTRGELRIDAERARRVAVAELAATRLPGRAAGPPVVVVDPSGTAVTVTLEVRVDRVMLAALPGAAGSETLTVTSRARLHR